MSYYNRAENPTNKTKQRGLHQRHSNVSSASICLTVFLAGFLTVFLSICLAYLEYYRQFNTFKFSFRSIKTE